MNDLTAQPAGLQATFLANQPALLRFLAARGAEEAAEDLLQELWIKGASVIVGPVGSPLSYLYRAADTLMIDRHRAQVAAKRRDRDWSEAIGPVVADASEEPVGERVLIARERAAEAQRTLSSLGERVTRIFCRHRLEGVPQRDLARDEGVSLSTVESDLRRAGRALLTLKERWHDE